MSITTKTGDKGETSLYGGARVAKDAVRIEAFGAVDELNAQIGVVRAMSLPDGTDPLLERIQNELFMLGADLATPTGRVPDPVKRIGTAEINGLEAEIERIEAALPPLRTFILPSGTLPGATLHVARTVCRRAERRVVRLVREASLDLAPVVYLNRLADLLFLVARQVNLRLGSAETPWTP